MTVSDLLEQPCYKSDNINKLVTSCSQFVPYLLTTWDKQCEHNLLTACWQTCYKMWDSYVCTWCWWYNLVVSVSLKAGVNFTASTIIVLIIKLTIFNYYFVFLNRQIHLKRLLTVYKLQNKTKTSNFERNAKKILGFKHFFAANTRHCHWKNGLLIRTKINVK
jgi:hypothetical protein